MTDLPDNSIFYLPKALPPSEEARIAIRVEEYRKSYEEFKKESFQPTGGKQGNLSPSQNKGLDSLMRRIMELEF